jgi:hypothetical protein
MSKRTIYSVSHFGVDLVTFLRLIEMHPKGEYRDLGGDTIVFKHEPTNDFQETWFLEDEDIDEYRERGEEE